MAAQAYVRWQLDMQAPAKTKKAIEARAKRNLRRLNQEVMAILNEAAAKENGKR